ncbi:MAG: ATP-binding protein [Ilumatobacteraceae bacterium]
MLADELGATFLTGGLSADQRAEFAAAGEEIAFEADTELFREGEPADHLWVLLEGSVLLTRQSGSETIVLTTMSTPGQWAGGLRAWGDAGGSAGYRATGRSVGRGRAFRLPSEDLGRLVGEWFPFGKHMMMGVFQTVRGIEATARQRESLVALGTLAAGLAHELNNPAAASLRAVEELRTTCDAMLSSLSSLARQTVSADQYVELDRLRQELAERPAPEIDAVATMDREDALNNWLQRRSVQRGWELAAQFASVATDQDWLERVEAAVGSTALESALRWVGTTITATALLSDLTDTTNRISNLVDAVKSYSQMDRATRQVSDIHEGIESTLVMLASKLGGIEVQRDFASDIPSVEVYPAELNQVWTNLIDNAIDAMEGHGTLRISSRRDDGHVVIDIADTGHGIDAHVQERVFEPFFTTKDVGKGTGLGLDISRRIVVERHSGEITFDSRPGATIAHVRLPISR